MRDLTGFNKHAVIALLTFCAVFHLYTAAFGVFTTLLQRSIHLFLLVPVSFFFYPAFPTSPKDRPSSFDWVWAGLATAAELFVVIDHARIYTRMEHLTQLLNSELILGSIAVIVIIEATRRCVSRVLAMITTVSLLYMLIGHWPVFGYFQHPHIQFQRVVEQLYLLGEQGIHGVVVGVSATYVFLFVLFGAFLIHTDVGTYIIDLASRLFGRSKGGPAKVAVASSCLFGSISGSGPANVYATGSFTIPLMKKMGYRPHFAAAVESAASTGGQYMPPVMGAVGFIIAEVTGTPYYEVCRQAIVSAMLYYFAIMCMVQFEANKLGLKGIPSDDLRSWNHLWKNFYLISPILLILGMIILKYTPFMAAFTGICLTFLLSFASKETRLTPRRLIKVLSEGSKNAIMIAVACSSVGIVAASVIYTGVGLQMTSMVMAVAEKSIYLAPLLTMIICIALGMGVPCVPAYVVTGVITLPIMTKLGFTGLGPHLFILYYAVIASVTPPVAVSAYAAASIAGSNPMTTAFTAARVAFVGFVIPFLFLFNDSLLLLGDLKGIVVAIFLACVVVVLGSMGMIGYYKTKLNPLMRTLCFAVCLACVYFIVS
ncbi:TRAP transporter fused permease subunit [Desulfobacula sp.]|uniref:TRAP transporter permease n=1 Tax=Desulfobacula sp. TaxID=2593537 RepID=UPI00260DAB52|nr:TRAP transporter fused permease subunit [Desulfobacula sp.]